MACVPAILGGGTHTIKVFIKEPFAAIQFRALDRKVSKGDGYGGSDSYGSMGSGGDYGGSRSYGSRALDGDYGGSRGYGSRALGGDYGGSDSYDSKGLVCRA